MSGTLIFNIIEDLPIADISAEQVDMDIELSIAVYVVIVDKDHLSPMDFEECVLEVGIVIQDIDEEDKEVLSLKNHKDIMEEDYDQLYRHLHVEYKDFNKRHQLYQCKIQRLEGKFKGPYMHTRLVG